MNSGRTLTVLSVAYPFAPVGPDAVGGAEQVLASLDEALVLAGHRSLVIACEGSNVLGTLLDTPLPTSTIDLSVRWAARQAVRARIRQALAMYEVDVVHLHGIDCEDYLADLDLPTLVTLHLDPGLYPHGLFERPNVHLVCVSESQRRECPPARGRVLETIHNGVPLNRLTPYGRKQNFALSLGRICPEKGFHLALTAARRAGVPLVLAGQVHPYPEHQEYFRAQLAPRLDSAMARFVGPVNVARKRRLLALAKCLLVPSQTRETSSLVAMEAMACGTPVIAFRAGALPEVIDDRRTGLLVDTLEEMAEALQRVDAIDPRACRQTAEERFSADRMTAHYLASYEQITAPRAPRSIPLEIDEVSTLEGLESLRPSWLDLWQRVPDASIFQHPDWLIPWCTPFDVHEPWMVMLHRAGRLVGVAPLLVYRRGHERVLTLMGAGVSDDQDVLVTPGEASQCMPSLWAWLAHRRQRFDVCELETVPRGSALWRFPPAPPAPPAAPASSWRSGARIQQAVRPVLWLSPDAMGLDQVAPRSIVSQVRYLRRRAARDGLPVHVDRVDHANFDNLFGELARLHTLRWAARGETGMLPDRLLEFHRQVARRMLSAGVLRLYILRLGDAAAAAFYGFHARRRTVYYLGGFESRFERYSPGTLVVAHALEQAILEDHATSFDFLRGAEAYKYAWGAVDEYVYGGVHYLQSNEQAASGQSDATPRQPQVGSSQSGDTSRRQQELEVSAESLVPNHAA